MKCAVVIGCMLIIALVMAQPITNSVDTTQKGVRIVFIVKATDSDFWQVVLSGARSAEKELGVTVVYQAPTSEADIDKQIAILENAIATKPDAIVIAPSTIDSLVTGIEEATEQGIKVIVIDSRANTDKYVSFIATDNYNGGKAAADMLAQMIKKRYGKCEGKVAIENVFAGISTATERERGFRDRLKETYPDLKVVGTRYNNNDVARAIADAEDFLTAHPDLVGFFCINNHCGDGVARAIEMRHLEDDVAAVAFDADPQEIEALKSGALDALLVQDPFGMGYLGISYAVRSIHGELLPKYIPTKLGIITRDNLDTEESQKLLYPELYY